MASFSISTNYDNDILSSTTGIYSTVITKYATMTSKPSIYYNSAYHSAKDTFVKYNKSRTGIGGSVNFVQANNKESLVGSTIDVIVSTTDGVYSWNDIDHTDISDIITFGDPISTASYRYIMLFYDVYCGNTLLAHDIPAGYIDLGSTVTINSSSAIYNAASTRVYHLQIGANNYNGTSPSTTSTLDLAQSFVALGECIQSLTDAMNKRVEDVQVLKQYLTEFKNIRSTNVPYKKDGQWMVNGRLV